MRIVIVGDVHGRKEPFLKVLKRAGAIDENGVRIEGVKVIQLGDLLDLGYMNAEADFYEWAKPYIDVQCVGNHELPAFAPNAEAVAFNGWADRDRDAEILVKRDFREGRFVAAAHVGDWLLTHAGLHPMFMQEGSRLANLDTAEQISEALNGMFINSPDHMIFNAIGAQRGGRALYGGIFWNDITDLVDSYQSFADVPQICGHSSYCTTGEQVPGLLWCIDTRGGCAALVTDDDGQTFELIVEEREPQPRRVRIDAEQVRQMLQELVADGELSEQEAQQIMIEASNDAS